MCTTPRKRRLRTAGIFPPPLVSYRGIAAIMLIDSTFPECAAGNIFLMDGASHFVIIFARDHRVKRSAKLSAAIGTKLERESPAVDLFPRQDAKFIIRARSLPRDYFLIARQNRGEYPFISLHPAPSPAMDWRLNYVSTFSNATEKLKNRSEYFWDFMKYFAWDISFRDMANVGDAFFWLLHDIIPV